MDAQREVNRLAALAVGLAYSDLDDEACVSRVGRAGGDRALVEAAQEELVAWSVVDEHRKARALQLLRAATATGADLPSGPGDLASR